jgi:hypothetical protein
MVIEWMSSVFWALCGFTSNFNMRFQMVHRKPQVITSIVVAAYFSGNDPEMFQNLMSFLSWDMSDMGRCEAVLCSKDDS